MFLVSDCIFHSFMYLLNKKDISSVIQKMEILPEKILVNLRADFKFKLDEFTEILKAV